MPALLDGPTTAQDWLERLGGIPAGRLVLRPAPGTATVDDVVRYLDGDRKRLVELVDGTLVEKAMGLKESFIAAELITKINIFNIAAGRLGNVSAPDGPYRLAFDLVRLPDVAFISKARLPQGKLPKESVPALVPNLAVEVLSESNTAAEMERKIGEYFEAGVELVWIIDPEAMTIEVLTAIESSTTLRSGETLTGGAVLPGFAMPVDELFANLPE